MTDKILQLIEERRKLAKLAKGWLSYQNIRAIFYSDNRQISGE